MAHDREVAGIRCLEVLAYLSDYLDGELSDELRARVEAHVADCDWCERFGGKFSSTVSDLRRLLREPEPADDETADRLLRRLGLDDETS
jgi:anti-sigma factor RsiW